MFALKQGNWTVLDVTLPIVIDLIVGRGGKIFEKS